MNRPADFLVEPRPTPPPRPAPPRRPARPPHFLRPPALTSFCSRDPLPPPPSCPAAGRAPGEAWLRPAGWGSVGGEPGRPRTGRGRGPGKFGCGRPRREVLGSLQVGRARPAGRGGDGPLQAGGGSGTVGSCTKGGGTGPREPRGTPEVEGSPAQREKSLSGRA